MPTKTKIKARSRTRYLFEIESSNCSDYFIFTC
nr:MAG TPA: hypothetical protein [Caudoviricetes sp.]